MKLRNLMYATMIACAFASCSNDDVPTPDNGNPDAQGGTSLTVSLTKQLIQKHLVILRLYPCWFLMQMANWKLSELK